MRQHAEWMTQADERILEYLVENSPGRPGEIRYGLAAVNEAMSYPQSYVDTRLDRLTARGLVAKRDDSRAYELTDRGSSFSAARSTPARSPRTFPTTTTRSAGGSSDAQSASYSSQTYRVATLR
jgi:predicted transcriptional regulator